MPRFVLGDVLRHQPQCGATRHFRFPQRAFLLPGGHVRVAVHSAARCPLPSAETEGVPPRQRKSVHSAESGNNLSAPGQASAIEGDMESQVSQGRLNKECVNHGNRWRTAILTSLFFFLFFFLN